MWAFLRALEEDEPRPRLWAAALAASFGIGLLLKSTVAVLFPAAAAALYLLLTRQLFSRKAWRRLHPLSGLALMLLIAAPWHVLATLRNPPLFRFHHAQRARRIPRLPVVLFHERAGAAVPEPALSARLQHRAARLVLAVPPALAVPLERVLSGGGAARLPAGGPRRADAPAGPVLDRFSAGVFQLFHDPGILLHALLPGAGAAAGVGHGGRRRMGAARHARAVCGGRMRGGGRGGDFAGGAEPAVSGRYFGRAGAASRRLHAVARPHGGSDPEFVRVSAHSAGAGGDGVPDRRTGRPEGFA